MILKYKSTGPMVSLLQDYLNVPVDGYFSISLIAAVKEWQHKHGLLTDGIVGPKTWDAMGIATTDNSETISISQSGLNIIQYYLPKDEYKIGPTNKEYIVLHHTAGWNNPYKCIDQWANDTRGTIATEFVIGGPSIKGDDFKYDGNILSAVPAGGYGWHLGKNGSQYMHEHSIGIELCNFGYIVNNKTYSGTDADSSQIITLDSEFRGYKHWHRYSDSQIESIRLLILYIAERDNIDIRNGLPKWIKDKGAKAFEFNSDAYYGKVKGLLTHSNIRKDKTDMFPQPELLDMLISL